MLPSPFPTVPPPEEDVLERLSRVAQQERCGLAGVARREGLSAEEAIDCVQDALITFLDLIQSGQLQRSADPGPVLVTIVRNAARNQRRRHHRAKPHADVGERELSAGGALQEELLARAEDTVRLRACVAELCEIQRAVVTLRLLEERPGENVAELLGVSANHVAVLLHRAKSALRTCMAD
jgi:RNA polymerase sigma-70 factor, ECF subfamily